MRLSRLPMVRNKMENNICAKVMVLGYEKLYTDNTALLKKVILMDTTPIIQFNSIQLSYYIDAWMVYVYVWGIELIVEP